MMKLLISYASRFWRRKATLVGILIGLAVFVLCAHLSHSSKNNNNNNNHRRPFVVAEPHEHPGAVPLKRLQNVETWKETVGESPDDDADNAFDTVNRGVKFVPGMNRAPVKPEPNMHPDVVEYYKSKNKLLYEARAKEKAAKKYAGKRRLVRIAIIQINRGFCTKLMHFRGDLQPEQDDDNTEYQGNDIQRDRVPPIYRSDRFQQQYQSEPEKPVYVPKERLVHFDLKGAPPKVSFFLSRGSPFKTGPLIYL